MSELKKQCNEKFGERQAARKEQGETMFTNSDPGYLTPHFKLTEFTASATATRKQIANVPTQTEVENIRNLCTKVLEPLREFAGRPIRITSGFRSAALNKAVGGAPSSQHLKGEAADIHVDSPRQARGWMEWMMDNCEFDQLILEQSPTALQCTHCF